MMLAEIKEKYKGFHDAIINEVSYLPFSTALRKSLKELRVSITCFNWQKEQWEDVIIVFKEVAKFKYIDTLKLQSVVVFEAMLKENEDGIIVDFYPIQVDGREVLEEYPDSTFLVHCKSVVLSHTTN